MPCSFDGANFRQDKEKGAENTLCIVKPFDAELAEIGPSKPCSDWRRQATGETDCHASDVGHWLAMTELRSVRCAQSGRLIAAPTRGDGGRVRIRRRLAHEETEPCRRAMLGATGETDCHASDVGHWLAMTELRSVRCAQSGRLIAAPTRGDGVWCGFARSAPRPRFATRYEIPQSPLLRAGGCPPLDKGAKGKRRP